MPTNTQGPSVIMEPTSPPRFITAMHCKKMQNISENLGRILTHQKISDPVKVTFGNPRVINEVGYSQLMRKS